MDCHRGEGVKGEGEGKEEEGERGREGGKEGGRERGMEGGRAGRRMFIHHCYSLSRDVCAHSNVRIIQVCSLCFHPHSHGPIRLARMKCPVQSPPNSPEKNFFEAF